MSKPKCPVCSNVTVEDEGTACASCTMLALRAYGWAQGTRNQQSSGRVCALGLLDSSEGDASLRSECAAAPGAVVATDEAGSELSAPRGFLPTGRPRASVAMI